MTRMRSADGGKPSALRRVRPRRWLRVAIILALILLVLVATGGVQAARLRGRFLPLEVAMPGWAGPETWLVVGVDDRAFLDEDKTWDDTTGARADIVVLVTRTDHGVVTTNLSRDLKLPDAKEGTSNRLTAFWLDGPQAMTDALCRGLGVPVDHLLRVDFSSFTAGIDAVGGIDLTLDHPVRDVAGEQGYWTLPAGTSHVDGRTALRWLRAREGEAFLDGAWVAQPDDGSLRQRRANQIIRALAAQVHQHPWRAPVAAWDVAPHVGLDRHTGLADLLPLAGVRDAAMLPSTVDPRFPLVQHATEETTAYLAGLGYTGCTPR